MQRSLYMVRGVAVVLALTIGYGALTRHLYGLQVRRHHELLAKARLKYTTQRTEQANRGRILDVNGNLLAGNLACRDILAEPWRFGDRAEPIVGVLAAELGPSPDSLRELFALACAPRQRHPLIRIAQRLEPEACSRLRAARINGIRLIAAKDTEARRLGWFGPFRALAHCVGASRQPPQDVILDTALFRDPEQRREDFAQLSSLLNVTAAELEVQYTRATRRNRHRPVEVVVRREVDMDTADRILGYRDLAVDRRRLDADTTAVIEILSQELNLPTAELATRFETARTAAARHTVVVHAVAPDRIKRIRAYQFAGLTFVECLPGIRVVDSSRRYYPKDSLMINLVGFTNSTKHGVTGVEALFDDRLQPVSGQRVYERDRYGTPLQGQDGRERMPRNGDDIYLTLSEPIQQIVEDELDRLVERHAPRAAFAVMANPKTGAVMALAQYPTFDPNDLTGITPEQWQNRVLVEGFEPGSVMKSVAIAGALDFGIVTLDSVYDCENGYWVFCRRPLRDSGHAFGELTVAEILSKSSNIGTAKIAIDMGERRLYQTLRRFGFGTPTGIGLEPEASGILRPLRRWDGLSISRFPIGQGVLVTPLQLVQAYAALANSGRMMQLHVIDRIRNPASGRLETIAPREKRWAVRPRTAAGVVSAMKQVAREGGTAPKAAVPGYEVAGKTGTAQKVIDGQYSHRQFVASFIGFAPADDPAFVLLVVADEPSQNGYYGGTVAAPTFSRIAEKTLRYLQVAPEPRAGPAAPYSTEMANHDRAETVADLP